MRLRVGSRIVVCMTPSPELRKTRGYLVSDRSGRPVGRVECPMYGIAPEAPDALSVKTRRRSRRRLLVPAAVIGGIDRAGGVIALTVDRETIRRFL